jgi:hypothetical protein
LLLFFRKEDLSSSMTLFGPRTTVAIFAILTAAVLAPVFAVPVPGLGDYLNHLARIDIMARIGHTPALQRFYQVDWRFVPYYGMDVPVLLLMRVLPVYVAGQVFVALCVMMPVMALAALRWAVHGRVGLVPVLGYVLSYNLVLAYGFLNYLFSAGLAVALFAAWIAGTRWPRWPRAALFSVGLVLLYLCHAFAAAAYCLMVAGYEIGRAARCGFRPAPVVALNWAAAGAQALPLVLLVHFTAGAVQLGAVTVTQYGTLGNRVAALLSPFFFPGGGSWAAFAILLALTGVLALRRVRMAAALWPSLAIMILAAVLVPKILLNVWGSDLRLPILCVVLLLACVSRGPAFPRRAAQAIVVLAVILAAGRSVAAYRVLSAFNQSIADIRGLLAAMPKGARLLVVELADEAAPRRPVSALLTGHMAMVAVIDRDAFVPYLFTGASAVRLRPAMAQAGSSNGGPITMADLTGGMDQADPSGGEAPFGLGGQVYWWHWPQKFDYVLIEHFGADPGPAPDTLRLVARDGIADLYRIAQTGAAAGSQAIAPARGKQGM